VLRKIKDNTSDNLGTINSGLVAYLEDTPFLKMGLVSSHEATAGTADETGAEGTGEESGWAGVTEAGGTGAGSTGANATLDEVNAGTAMASAVAAAGIEMAGMGADTAIGGGGDREAILTEPAILLWGETW
jgi:hypothetical protein